jgi:undecaprenyl-diphosphatase
MNVLHAILLGLVQGLTEFLPVSSTAHLTLAENLLLKQSMPLAFDVLLHGGTLLALLIYFRSEVLMIFQGLGQKDSEGRRLAIWLCAAMVPTIVFALLTKHLKEAQKGHMVMYGGFLLLTALLLWAANTLAKRREGKAMAEMNLMDALCIGAIQGLGGGFGLSRSGSTISMGVFRKMSLPASVRFSFLLGIPTIGAAFAYEGLGLMKMIHKGVPVSTLFPAGSASPTLLCGIGVITAAISGYAAIGILDRFTRKPRLMGFAVYCALIGVFIITFEGLIH